MWSTIFDAPVSDNMTEEEVFEYFKENKTSFVDFDESMKSLKENGVFNPYYSLEDVLETNDIGCKTLTGLIRKLCH